MSASPLVVVDALNVARSRWPNLPLERLVELTKAWAEREGVEALVVFDGAAPVGCAGASVIGTGSGTADDWIAEHAPRLVSGGRRLWLVTSDRELRGRVRPQAERVIGGGSFAGQLEALERSLS